MKRLLFQRITTFYTISSIYILSNPILPITKVTGMTDRFHQIDFDHRHAFCIIIKYPTTELS